MKIFFGLLLLLAFANAASTLVKLTRTERRMLLLEKLLDRRGLMRCIFYHDLRQEPDRECLVKYHISQRVKHFVSILSSIIVDVVFQRHTCNNNKNIPELKTCIRIVKFDFRRKFHLYIRTVEERTIFLEIVNKFIRYFTHIKMRKDNMLHLDTDQALSFRQPPALEGKITSDFEPTQQIALEPESEPLVQNEPENQNQPTDSSDVSSRLNGLADKLQALKQKIMSTFGGQETDEPVASTQPANASPEWLKNLVQAYKNQGAENNEDEANVGNDSENKQQEQADSPIIAHSIDSGKPPCDQVAEKIAGLPDGAQQFQTDQAPLINIYPVTKEEQQNGETVNTIQPMVIIIAPLDALKKIQPQLEQQELAFEKQKIADEEFRKTNAEAEELRKKTAEAEELRKKTAEAEELHKKNAEALKNQMEIKKAIANNLATLRRREPTKENENSFMGLKITPKAPQEQLDGSSKIVKQPQPNNNAESSSSSEPVEEEEDTVPESSTDEDYQPNQNETPTKSPVQVEQEPKIQPIKSSEFQELLPGLKAGQQKEETTKTLPQGLGDLKAGENADIKPTLPTESQNTQQSDQAINKSPASSLTFITNKNTPVIEKRHQHGPNSKIFLKPKIANDIEQIGDEKSPKIEELQNTNLLEEALQKKHQKEQTDKLNEEAQNQKEKTDKLDGEAQKNLRQMFAEKLREKNENIDEPESELSLSKALAIPEKKESGINTGNDPDFLKGAALNNAPGLTTSEKTVIENEPENINKDEEESSKILPSKVEVNNTQGVSALLARKATKIIPTPTINNIVLKDGSGKDKSDADDAEEAKTRKDNGEKIQPKTPSQNTSSSITEKITKEPQQKNIKTILTQEQGVRQQANEQSEPVKKQTTEAAMQVNLDPSENKVKLVAIEVKDVGSQTQVTAQNEGDMKDLKTAGQQTGKKGNEKDQKEAPKTGDDKNKKEAAKDTEKKDPCHASLFNLVVLLVLSIILI